MAYYAGGDTISIPTDSDLSGSKYCCVRMSSGKAVVAANATSPILGILTDNVEDGSTYTRAVSVGISGIRKAIVGAAGVTSNSAVTATASGHVINATAGDHIVGHAMETGTSGQIVPVRVAPSEIET